MQQKQKQPSRLFTGIPKMAAPILARFDAFDKSKDGRLPGLTGRALRYLPMAFHSCFNNASMRSSSAGK
jgi:hypothetical protein